MMQISQYGETQPQEETEELERIDEFTRLMRDSDRAVIVMVMNTLLNFIHERSQQGEKATIEGFAHRLNAYIQVEEEE